MSVKSLAWIPESIRFGTDPVCSADIEQLTSDAVTSTNIYCEQRYASADGSRIAIERKPFGRPVEIWVCNMPSLRICKIAEGRTVGANSSLDAVYYVSQDAGVSRLMRLDLKELVSRELFEFDGPAPSCGSVSPDERVFVCGPYPVEGKKNVYSLCRIDLADKKMVTLCEVQDMFNPHLQFDPGNGSRAFVQINRGGVSDFSKDMKSFTGPLGATLALVDVETGKISPLPVGRPHTPSISGHEAWAGKSGRIFFTAGQYDVSSSSYVKLKNPPDQEKNMPAAAIYSVTPGDSEPGVLAKGLVFNHISVSDDGRFFTGDNHDDGVIHVGNSETGRYLPLCHSHTRQGSCQHSHVHSYMTPDNKYVIFNSIVTGIAQVYAACIPDGFLDKVINLKGY
ncbi:MAG TPA: hypothetical protein DET40_07140 [Lentisphaeria bacterium]|nr:MAG: hypothetical protein A2X45_07160 [Lentisphaerae bacterium GWF2_50_93]HCE43306.1 hypothetical protein [Lentisphaeria bacterium]